MKRFMLAVLCLFVVGILALGSTAIGGENEGELTNLRYQSGKIRGTFTLYNNSNKHMKHAKVQVSLHDNKGRIIGSTRSWFSNIPPGEFGSQRYFWEGTTESDLTRVETYRWRITFQK